MNILNPRVRPCDGDQLRLDLFAGVPWDGVSPRGLTRAKIVLSSRQEPLGHEVEPDPAQLEMWPVSVRPPRGKRLRQAAGAPSLLPLKAPRMRSALRERKLGENDAT